MSKPTAKECNYFGFDHDAVAKQFGGDLSYVGDMCMKGRPVAVYRAASPDRSKGHKEFMTLSNQRDQVWIGGMELDQLKEHSIHVAVLCTQCNTVLYSVHRHHFHKCDCPNETFVDGGKEYLRAGAKSMAKVKTGLYDVLTKIWTEAEDAA